MRGGAQFNGRIVLLGYGTIGRCALPLVRDLMGLGPERLVVVDKDDHSDRLASEIAAGLGFLRREITPDTLAAHMDEVARAGDLLLNLSVGIDSIELADWCHHHGVLYVDTAIEPWEDHVWDISLPASERTEYAFHQRARAQARSRWRADGPTAVFTHGANPGLVSHFAKEALLEVARATNLAHAPPAARRDWARLARATGTRVIHISERDTQVSPRPKRPGEFVNTWSIPGFVEEAMMPVEIGWGTHERALPAGALSHDEGPGNTIYLPRPGGELLLYSWVPEGGQILGLALPHSESITLSDYLTLEEAGAAVYRPTVVFVYLACDAAMASLHETRMRGWAMQSEERVLMEDITAGQDELGVLLLGHGRRGWWYGSQLDIDAARRLVPHTNPTAMQVAAGAASAAVWAARNPGRGYCEPEDLPHEEILALARPYLGTIASQATDWSPLAQRRAIFGEAAPAPDDPWQFANFVA